ncbi:MAG: type II toxin-antitoxin system Phd/YefM family antitoxin [Candidatus Accumulibacter sp.]|jgi:prevent-host-death family protein|nr:type II toxin-antitoxin system Phd/YefM family antitoxin [Accumulibacter sp.]
MITEISAVNFRQNLGEMLNQVQYRNDSIVINKGDKPVAVLVNAEPFSRIRRMREHFDALSERIAEAIDSDHLPEYWLSETETTPARQEETAWNKQRTGMGG